MQQTNKIKKEGKNIKKSHKLVTLCNIAAVWCNNLSRPTELPKQTCVCLFAGWWEPEVRPRAWNCVIVWIIKCSCPATAPTNPSGIYCYFLLSFLRTTYMENKERWGETVQRFISICFLLLFCTSSIILPHPHSTLEKLTLAHFSTEDNS